MSTAPVIPLSLVTDVAVTVSLLAVASPLFNQGLIVGNSGRIPTTGANARLRPYASTQAMLADVFMAGDPEVIAAGLYFAQNATNPAPTLVWIGAQDPTAIAAAAIDGASAGTGYVVGDLLSITQAGASGAVFKVTTIGANGAITGGVITAQGTKYSVATGLATTGGTGTGAEINVTAIGETALQAVTACRAAQSAWYGCMVCTAADSDHLALAAYAQSAQPQMAYTYATADAAIPAGAANNLFAQMQALSYNRVLGFYSTTQGGLYPNNAYTAAAVLGFISGANTALANSYYTLMFKKLVGVAPEPLTVGQVIAIAGQPGVSNGLCGNVLITLDQTYSMMMQGLVPNGQNFGDIVQIDMLAADLQVSETNLLIESNTVPQDDGGQTIAINRANGACSRSQTRGFLTQGTWNGQQLLTIANGDALPNGYKCVSPSFSTQTQAQKALGQGMPIYIALNTAGAIRNLSIGVSIQ